MGEMTPMRNSANRLNEPSNQWNPHYVTAFDPARRDSELQKHRGM